MAMVMLRADDWVVVRNCGWLFEADVLVAVLHGQGIDAFMFIPDAHMAAIRPELIGFMGGIHVLVPSSQLALAHEALVEEAPDPLPARGMLMADWD
jgi:hypothetical protein